MNWIAWTMLNGDTAPYLGTVFGVAKEFGSGDTRVLQVLCRVMPASTEEGKAAPIPLVVGQQLDVQVEAALGRR